MEPDDSQSSGNGVVPVLAVFFVLSAIATAAAAVAASSTNGASIIVATNAGVTVGPGQTSTARIVTSAPQPTITTGTLPAAPGNTTPAVAAGSWPSGTSGYTDILQSVPISEGRARAKAMSRQAASAGLPQTGVLDSKSYRSLRRGYYVVFSGIYPSPVQAAAALASAHARGFPGAYVARVSQ